MNFQLSRYNPIGSTVRFPGYSNLWREFFRGWDLDNWAAQEGWAPAVDVEEGETEYTVRADLPGIAKKDIKITLKDGLLAIEGERKAGNEEQDAKRERVRGAFSRSFSLPESIDLEKVKAAYQDGVLTVTLPKKEEAKPKEITVKVE